MSLKEYQEHPEEGFIEMDFVEVPAREMLDRANGYYELMDKGGRPVISPRRRLVGI